MTSAFFGLPDESLKTKKAQATILLMLPYIYKCGFFIRTKCNADFHICIRTFHPNVDLNITEAHLKVQAKTRELLFN